MSSVARRSGSKLSRILARAADPGALTSRAQLYAKVLSAVAHLYARSSGGIVHQLTGPGAVFPTNYVDGLGVSWASVATVNVAAGIARSDDDTFNIALAAQVTANIGNVGVVNGLDTGAEAADAWYAIWVIGDSTGVNPAGSLLSASFSAPTLPAGYDKKRRIGCVRNTASNFARFIQYWTGKTRRYYFDRDGLNVVAGGNATTFTSVSAAAFAPPTSRNLVINWFFTVSGTGAVTDMMQVRPGGANSSDGPHQLRRGVTLNSANMRHTTETPCSDTQTLEYKVTQTQNAATIRVLAFDDEI